MKECCVCGKKFELRKENRYEVMDHSINAIFNQNSNEAFDCPYCGCQNIVNKRLAKLEVNKSSIYIDI